MSCTCEKGTPGQLKASILCKTQGSNLSALHSADKASAHMRCVQFTYCTSEKHGANDERLAHSKGKAEELSAWKLLKPSEGKAYAKCNLRAHIKAFTHFLSPLGWNQKHKMTGKIQVRYQRTFSLLRRGRQRNSKETVSLDIFRQTSTGNESQNTTMRHRV